MSESLDVVKQWFAALRSRDLSEGPLAEDIQYDGPLMPGLKGADNVRRFLRGYLASVRDLQVIRHFVDGEDVATELHVETAFADFSMVYISRVHDGQITEMRSFWDPRPFVQGMGEQ